MIFPLKRYKKFKTAEGAGMEVIFKFERLPNYCFICGIIDHGENSCPKAFALDDAAQEVIGPKLWAQMGKKNPSVNTRWLHDE